MLAGTANVEVAREGLKEFASVDENDGLPSASDGFVTVQSATPAKNRKEEKKELKKSPSDLLKVNAEKGKADAGKGRGKDTEEDIDMSKFTVTKVAKDSTNKQPITYNMAEILRDDQVYKLEDLLATGFEMPVSDNDFRLSHEQLIKVTKIILHKMNLLNRKNDYEKEDTIKR